MFIASIPHIWPETTIAQSDGDNQPLFEGH